MGSNPFPSSRKSTAFWRSETTEPATPAAGPWRSRTNQRPAPSRRSRFLRLGHRLFAPTVKQDQVFRAALLETDTGSRFREACARFLYSARHLMVRHSLLPTFFVLYRTHVKERPNAGEIKPVPRPSHCAISGAERVAPSRFGQASKPRQIVWQANIGAVCRCYNSPMEGECPIPASNFGLGTHAWVTRSKRGRGIIARSRRGSGN